MFGALEVVSPLEGWGAFLLLPALKPTVTIGAKSAFKSHYCIAAVLFRMFVSSILSVLSS